MIYDLTRNQIDSFALSIKICFVGKELKLIGEWAFKEDNECLILFSLKNLEIILK